MVSIPMFWFEQEKERGDRKRAESRPERGRDGD